MNSLVEKIKTRFLGDSDLASVNAKADETAGELMRFRDIHKGEHCFIMGNGPSLNSRYFG